MNYTHIKSNQKPKPDLKNQSGKAKPALVIMGIIFAFLLTLGLGVVFLSKNAKALFDPISIVSSISRSDIKQTDGRTNFLVLGRDTRPSGSINDLKLTDVILVGSVGQTDKDVVLISVPRDLWVETSEGYQEKINAVYKIGGINETKKVIEGILGIPMHYYAVVDFQIFKDTVNTLGGVDVDVERGFTDYTYPVEGKENAPENERYTTVHFEPGIHTMDGDTALKYVRSRHSTNPEESTDFARSQRQQKVVLAIKDKALSNDTLLNPTKLAGLYTTYAKNVETNIDLLTAQSLASLAKQSDFSKIRSVVLDDRNNAETGGLLYTPEDRTLYRNAYVLLPKAGDYSQIQAFVQRYLFSTK